MNTFRRQLTLVVCLFLAATILLGAAFWLLFTRYALRQQYTSMRATAQSVTDLIGAFSGSRFGDWELHTDLALTASASQTDILICSAQGEVRICADEIQSCPHLNRRLSAELAEQLFAGEQPELTAEVSEIYGESRLAVAQAITLNGSPYVIVVVSVPREQQDALTADILQIFCIVALIVLAVLLLALPLLTRRETAPIGTMAAAARQIAHGNLDVRVPTGYQNAEIEELAVAFNNMADALRRSETARQEFVANVSHELKTPMTTISGYLDGMLDGTIPPEHQREYMERVSAESRRLSRLVRSMLDVSRLKDQGVEPDRMTSFDLCDSIGTALLSFEQRITRKNLNVDVDLPELGIPVVALADSITQVIYNLLDNAVKFVDEGGRLSVRAERRGDQAFVAVGNSGAGIAPEELPLVFDRFHKTDKSRSGDRDGVGLGLYIVKTIVLAHGGDIYVTSQNGWTEFSFTLPVKPTKK